MAIAKKGARKITINQITYLFKVSKIKKKSDWRAQNDELDETFLKYARYNGIGQVKDITINIVIQLAENPISKMLIKINTILINGFMGAEQITQVKPKLIAELVNIGLNNGWKPSLKGDYRLNLLETNAKAKKPILLYQQTTKLSDE